MIGTVESCSDGLHDPALAQAGARGEMTRRSALLCATLVPLAATLPPGSAAARSTAKVSGEIFVPAQRVWAAPPAMTAASSGPVKLTHTSLYHWDTGGTGEPIVLLHPATGSHEVWAYQQRAFAQAGYRVIGYSRRGYLQSSESDPAAGGGDAEDLRELLALLKVERPHLVGSAAGGFTAMEFARRWPGTLRSLTIASSLAGTPPPADGKRSALQIPGWMQLPASFRELGPSYRAANPAGVALWEAIEQRAMHGPRAAFGPALPGGTIGGTPGSTTLPPMLVLTGDADLYMPPPMLRGLATSLGHVRSAVFAEAGHAVFWEQPEGFNRIVLDFIAGTSRRRPTARPG